MNAPALGDPMASPSPGSSLVNQIYAAIKAQEINFPLPQPQPQLTVGTFNASNGSFSYAVPTYQQIVPILFPDEKPPVRYVTHTGGNVPAINAIPPISLRFNIINRPVGSTFSAQLSSSTTAGAGVTVAANPGEDYVSLDIASLGNSVNFTLRCSNGKEFSCQLPAIVNSAMCGAGAFTIPAWPVAIVYAPPVNQQKSNQTKWKITQGTGSTTVLTFTQGSSGGQPVSGQFAYIADLVQAIGVAKGLMGAIGGIVGGSGGSGGSGSGGGGGGGGPIAVISGIVDALSVIASLMGSETDTLTTGTSVSSQNSLTTTITEASEFDTSPGLGPGVGDYICCLKNARFCWLAWNGQLTLSFLGSDALNPYTVSALPSVGFDPITLQALLALDPFVAGGPEADLPAGRFVLFATHDVTVGAQKYTDTYSYTEQDTQQVVQTTTTLDDQRAGWLGFLGIGVEDSVTVQATLSQTSSVNTQTDVTVSNEVDLNAETGETYTVEVYSDVVFGTFAYRQRLFVGHL